MQSICVRQTELPNTSALFADVLYNPERTERFYFHPYRDLTSYRASAGAIEFPEGQRARLVEALAEQNACSPALDRLAQPGTVAVVTGQQVGLFSGPCYTIYKLLHAVKLAEWLSSSGIPAVPVFWLATEDHDFAEVNHAWVFDADHRPRKLEMRRAANGQPVGSVQLVDPPVEELRAAIAGLPFADEVTAAVEQSYRTGVSMGNAFAELVRRLAGAHDVLQLDPMLPQFRALAAPALRRAVEAADDLTAGVLDRNRELEAAGYHAQVHVEPETSFVFLLENGKRATLRRQGRDYVLNGRRFSPEHLASRAESLSPNALLRPVVQDSMLPSVAYIGGPAETAYLAQSEVFYRKILGRMPVAVPRTGFTILDGRSRKLMERHSVKLQDFYHGEDALRERMAEQLVPPSVKAAIEGTAGEIERALARLRAEMAEFDATLAKAADRSGRKIRYQFDKIARKAGREAIRRDARATKDAAYLYGLVYPERHLQERLYSILPFVAKHGPELIDRIYEAIQLDCADHRLLFA
jgi:bacillithiol biosynthesis cysteine-adding enzyme BshC